MFLRAVRILPVIAGVALPFGCVTTPPVSTLSQEQPGTEWTAKTPWPRYSLAPDAHWHLSPPGRERFDASGLAFLPSGELLVVNNLSPRLHVVRLGEQPPFADLVPWPGGLSTGQLAPLERDKRGAWDFEGLAVDDSGRLYLSEEGNYWVLRMDPGQGSLQRLALDWRGASIDPRREDPNASLEGVAVGGGRLFVAKERSPARIFVFDAETLEFRNAFAVRGTRRGMVLHYSDLCWFDGSLYVMLRHQRCVLKLDPCYRRVLAEYDFRELERHPEFAYRREYSTGVMEGLAVDRTHFWLVTDNNGLARKAAPGDIRPTLFRCRRPDA